MKDDGHEKAVKKAFRAVAKERGITVKEFKKRIVGQYGKFKFTSRCFTLEDLKNFPNLSNNKLDHFRSCDICQVMMRDSRQTCAPKRHRFPD